MREVMRWLSTRFVATSTCSSVAGCSSARGAYSSGGVLCRPASSHSRSREQKEGRERPGVGVGPPARCRFKGRSRPCARALSVSTLSDFEGGPIRSKIALAKWRSF